MADDILRTGENLTLANGGGHETSSVGVGADGAVHLPAGFNFGTAEFTKAGPDLIMTAPDGRQVVVEDYFASEKAPNLQTPQGGELAGDTAARLAAGNTPAQFAAAASGAAEQPIGQVQTITGTVTAIRANGTKVELSEGDPVFQGDIIQSGPAGSLGIVLADETTFSMAENGRMVLDEMVYDPSTQEGNISMSVLQGVFTFVSGQVAKVDPDAMSLKTPVATIGIRGTQVGVNLGEEGGTPKLDVVLMEERDGFVGEVVISNNAGIQILNLPDQGTRVSRIDVPPPEPHVISRVEVRESYGHSLDHLPQNVGTGNNYQPKEAVPGQQGSNTKADPAKFETAAGGNAKGDEFTQAAAPKAQGAAEGDTAKGNKDLVDLDLAGAAKGAAPAPGVAGFETAAGGNAGAGGKATDEFAVVSGPAGAHTTGDGTTTGAGVVDFEVAAGGNQNPGGAADGTNVNVSQGLNETQQPQPTVTAPATGGGEQAPVIPQQPQAPTTPDRPADVVVTPNQGPTAVVDAASLKEDSSVVIAVKTNDTDPDGGTITVTGIGTPPAHGKVVLNPDGTVSYTPDADYNGTDTFTYTISDGQGGTSVGTVNITVDPENDLPVAVNDSFILNEDAALTIAPASLLSNDSDVDVGQTLSITAVSGATHGTVAIVNGNVVFTPATDYSGAASFTYTVSDGNGGTATATVNLTIAPQGDVSVTANNASGNEDTAINLGLSSSSFSITDTDNSETLSQIKLTFSNLPAGAVVNGATWSAAAGAYLVTSATALSNVTVIPPSNWNGQFGATLTVTSNEGATAKNFTVTALAVNDAPVVTSSPAFATSEDTAITLTKAQLLAGATDVDSDTLSVQNLVVNGGQGTLSGPNASGDYTYTPPLNYSGSIGLSYKVSDGTVTVNQTAAIGVTAVADAPAVTAALGTPIAVITNAVTASQAINVSNVTSGTNGFTVTAQKINSDGTLSTESSSNISISNSGNPTGFGVSGAASGDATELGRSSAGVSEQLNIQLAADVTSAKVTFAWMATSEHAQYKLYDNGVLVGTGTITGQTDNIDPEITITATNGVPFDKMVFTAPGADDDYLINNISFTKVITPGSTVAQYPLNISAALTDSDGSESLSTIRVTGVPSTATLSAGTKNADGSYTLTQGQLSGLKINVTNGQTTDFNLSVSATSTETSNADAKTTTVSIPIAAPDFTASSPMLTTAAASGFEDKAIALNISSALTDTDGSETLSVTISGVPTGATLSAGTNNGNGSWTLTPAQLSGLKITPADDSSTDFTLQVTAKSTESMTGATATTTSNIAVTVAGVADVADLTVGSSVMTTAYGAVAVGLSNATVSAIQSGYTVTISNVPTGATLSAGTNNGDGTWTVPGASASTLTITPPANYSGTLNLGAAVVNPNGGTSSPFGTAQFASGAAEGFAYSDNLFGTSGNTSYETGSVQSSGNYSGGGLKVTLGNTDTDGSGLSGGFTKAFTTSASGSNTITFTYKVEASSIETNDSEYARVMVNIDGTNKGTGGYVAQVVATDTGWVTVTVDLGTLSAGNHTLKIGGLVNHTDNTDDIVNMYFDNISVSTNAGAATVATQSSIAPALSVSAITYDLDIAASLNDATGESLTVQLSNIPSGVSLNHGTLSAGVWTVASSDLDDLTMTVPQSTGAFDMSISAKSTDSDGGDTVTITKTMDFSDFKGLATNDTLTGTSGNDTQYGGAGNDTINSGAGNDTVWGGSGNDTINAGDGIDTVYGGAGTDTIHGDAGNDTIYGGTGAYIIYGDAGNDIIIGGEGNDTLYGGTGADTFVFNLGDGTDTVMGFENGDQLNFNGISLNGGDQVGISASGNDVVITIIGQDGTQGSAVTLKDAAIGMTDTQKEHISDGYSVTDTGNGVSVVIDQNS